MSDLRFSPDGDYIYGHAYQNSQLRIIDMRPYIDDETSALSYCFSESGLASPPRPSDCSAEAAIFGRSGLQDFFASLATSKAPALLQVNEISARMSEEVVESSAIRRFPETGAVAHMTVKPGGSHVETLAYLPKGAENLTLSLVDPFADKDPLRLVMVNEPKESYAFGDPKSLMLPKVVDRQRSSIASHDLPGPERLYVPYQDLIMPTSSPDPLLST